MPGIPAGSGPAGRSRGQKQVRSRLSWRLISSMRNLGKTIPPSAWLGAAAAGSHRGTAPACGFPRGSAWPVHSQLVPAGSFTRIPSCSGLPRVMLAPSGRPVAEIVTLLEKRLVGLFDRRFVRRHALHDGGEVLIDHHRRIAGSLAWLLIPATTADCSPRASGMTQRAWRVQAGVFIRRPLRYEETPSLVVPTPTPRRSATADRTTCDASCATRVPGCFQSVLKGTQGLSIALRPSRTQPAEPIDSGYENH